MILAYFNYPNSVVRIHGDTSCATIRQQHKEAQRRYRVDRGSISGVLRSFAGGEVRFASTAELNDAWLEVDFSDPVFEAAVVAHIHILLGRRYSPIAKAKIDRHCG